MTGAWGRCGYRWRLLTPEQGQAVRDALIAGVRAVDLAKEYGVNRRTIYREAKRARSTMAVVTVFGQSATFVVGDDGEPIRMTAWTPA